MRAESGIKRTYAIDPRQIVEQEMALMARSRAREGSSQQIAIATHDKSSVAALVDKAYKIRSAPSSILGSDDNLRRLIRLWFYQPVIYCDDSSSMTSCDNSTET
jgi:hypothetical protein